MGYVEYRGLLVTKDLQNKRIYGPWGQNVKKFECNLSALAQVKICQSKWFNSKDGALWPFVQVRLKFRMFFLPLQLRVTTTSKIADDVSVCTLRITELSTLLMHIRVKQSQMCDTISGNMDTSSHCDMLTDFQCSLEPHSLTKALCISRNSAMSSLIWLTAAAMRR